MNVLNKTIEVQKTSQDALKVSQDLQKIMLRMKAEFMTDSGDGVKYQELRESVLYEDFVQRCSELQTVDLSSLSAKEKKAFFINIYNVLTIHGLASRDVLPGSVLEIEKFWRNTGYIISGHEYSLDDIEHGVLRGNRPHPSSPELFFKPNDPRLVHTMLEVDPQIHFALVCGAKSCPPISVYSEKNLDFALNAATKNYLNSEIQVHSNQITLPKLLSWYGSDFGADEQEIVRWTLPYLDEALCRDIKAVLELGSDWKVVYSDYNWHINSA